MNIPTVLREKTTVDISAEVMVFGLRLGVTTCALIGVWATCCLLAGVISSGPVQMLRGYVTAITGF